MSITVNIYYTGINGNARKFAEEMVTSGIVDAIKAEKGNERYEYFFSMNDPETILLIDSWNATIMMEQITELRNKYDLHMKVERYTSNEENITSADKKFIRL